MEWALIISAVALGLSVAAFYQTHLRRFSPEFSFGQAIAASEPEEDDGEHFFQSRVIFNIPIAVANHGAKSGFVNRLWIEGDGPTRFNAARRVETEMRSLSWTPVPLAPKGSTTFEIVIHATGRDQYPFEEGPRTCTLYADTSQAERTALLTLSFRFSHRDFAHAAYENYLYPVLEQEKVK